MQHNGTYYLLTSSFLSFPSLPIYTSTDLVHWTLRGNVVSHPRQLERLREAGVRWPIGGGMWAPSLRFREGEGCWYVTVTLVFPQTEFGAKERWENVSLFVHLLGRHLCTSASPSPTPFSLHPRSPFIRRTLLLLLFSSPQLTDLLLPLPLHFNKKTTAPLPFPRPSALARPAREIRFPGVRHFARLG